MNSKLLGAILLIVGTSIGGGMLGLPLTIAAMGFWWAMGLLFACWFLMTGGALCILAVNLRLAPGTNMISMAQQTFGRPGKAITWFLYLALLYSLMSAYIASGGDVLHGVLRDLGFASPLWFDTVLFTGVITLIVILGIRLVDYCNRGLMSIKLFLFLGLAIFIAPHIQFGKLEGGHLAMFWGPVMVAVTSFGFGTIIPSLRVYLLSEPDRLRRAIIIGSLIPLGVYIVWIMLILGTLPKQGAHGLLQLQHSVEPISELSRAIAVYMNNRVVTTFAHLFASVCVITSFLAVSLGLTDFLADGFAQEKKGLGGVLVFSAAFLPPLLIVMFYPHAFLVGLKYAGIFCVSLLLILPILMLGKIRINNNELRKKQ